MGKYLIHEQNGVKRFFLTKVKYLWLLIIVIVAFNTFVTTSIPISAQANSSSININNLLEYHNKERLNNGAKTLKLNYYLSVSAQNKANAMIDSDCWSHFCPDGKSPWEFINESGYEYTIAGENLAEGFYSVDEVMKAWLNSPTHKANMLKDTYKEVGFGIAYGTFQGRENNIVIVVHFATSRNEATATLSNGSLVLTNPKNGDIITSDEVELVGAANEVDNIFVYRNERFEGSTNVQEGIFTFRLADLEEGAHSVNIEGVDRSNIPISSDMVRFFVSSEALTELSNENEISTESSGLSITPENKELVNLLFVAILAVIFLIDFYVITHTDFLKGKKSFSHYHFSIFIIIGIVILSGGFSGHIGNGISSL